MLEPNDIKKDNNQDIYLSIDHLKNGHYILNIILKNKVIKSIKINKTESIR